MPLPSLINGAKQCQVLTKRTKKRCKNPAAYGCKACRMHGAHKSRNVLKGVEHPRHTKGERTKEAENVYRSTSISLLTLRDIGDYLKIFKGTHTRGRRPNGYKKYDLKDTAQLIQAIISTKKRF